MFFSCIEGKIDLVEKLSISTARDSSPDSLCHDVHSVTWLIGNLVVLYMS